MRATVFVLIALTLASCGSTKPAPAPTDDVAFGLPGFPATPTATSAPTARPSVPPGTAEIEGRVIDASTRTPVAGATVRLVPFNVVLTSTTDGSFVAQVLPVTGRCRWLTIEVDAPGYGRLVTIDNPLYQGHHAYVDLHVRAEEQRSYMGPPRSEAHLGEAFCSR